MTASAAAASSERPRLTPGVMAVLGAMNLIDCINYNLLVPYVDKMVSSFLGRPTDDPHVVETVGLLIGIYSLCEVVFSPFWGYISDRIGRRPVLLIGLAGSTMAPILFGFASSLPMVFFARALDGFFCGNIGVTKTYLGELVDETNEARGFSLLGVCFSMGLLIGPMLGGMLVFPAQWAPALFAGTVFETFPYLLPNLIYGSLAVVALVIGVVSLPETLPREVRRERAAAAAARARENAAASALLDDQGGGAASAGSTPPGAKPWCGLNWTPRLALTVFAYVGVSGYQASWVQNFILITSLPSSDGGFALGPAQIGVLQNGAAVGLLTTQLLLYPRCAKRWGYRKCIGFGFVLTLSFTLLFPVYGLLAGATSLGLWRYAPLLVLQVFATIGAGFIFPTVMACINRFARGNGDLGALNGVTNSLGALSRAVVPPFESLLLSAGLSSGLSYGRYLGVFFNALVGLAAWSLFHRALHGDVGMVRKPELREPLDEAAEAAPHTGGLAAAP